MLLSQQLIDQLQFLLTLKKKWGILQKQLEQRQSIRARD